MDFRVLQVASSSRRCWPRESGAAQLERPDVAREFWKVSPFVVGKIASAAFFLCLIPEHSIPMLSRSRFRVRWRDGAYPTNAECSLFSACRRTGDGCLCSTSVVMTPVFNSSHDMPNATTVESELQFGVVHPPGLDYVSCATEICAKALDNGVSVYTHVSSAGKFDQLTIFGFRVNGTLVYRFNKASYVAIPGTTFTFRNPVRVILQRPTFL